MSRSVFGHCFVKFLSSFIGGTCAYEGCTYSLKYIKRYDEAYQCVNCKILVHATCSDKVTTHCTGETSYYDPDSRPPHTPTPPRQQKNFPTSVPLIGAGSSPPCGGRLLKFGSATNTWSAKRVSVALDCINVYVDDGGSDELGLLSKISLELSQPLHGLHVALEPDSNRFYLTSAQARLYFEAPTHSLALLWIDLLEKAISDSPLPTTPDPTPDPSPNPVTERTSYISYLLPSFISSPPPTPPLRQRIGAKFETLDFDLEMMETAYNWEDYPRVTQDMVCLRRIPNISTTNVDDSLTLHCIDALIRPLASRATLTPFTEAAIDSTEPTDGFPDEFYAMVTFRGSSCRLKISRSWDIKKVIRNILVLLLGSTPVDRTTNLEVPNNYVLRFGGERQFLHCSDVLLRNVRYVRNRVRHNRDVDVEILPRAMVENSLLPSSNKTARVPPLSALQHIVSKTTFISAHTLPRMLQVRVGQLVNYDHSMLPQEARAALSDKRSKANVYVELSLVHGTKVVDVVKSQPVELGDDVVRFDQRLESLTPLLSLPLETVLAVSVFTVAWRPSGNISELLGYAALPLTDVAGFVRSGHLILRLWPLRNHAASGIGDYWTEVNPDPNSMTIELSFDSPPERVAFPGSLEMLRFAASPGPPAPSPSPDDVVPLAWENRLEIRRSHPEYLADLVALVDWTDRVQAVEMRSLLDGWPLLEPLRCLALLDASVPDRAVRAFAVECLHRCSNQWHIELILPQLVQALRWELHSYNALACYLLKTAVERPIIATGVFWQLHCASSAAAPDPRMRSRFSMYLALLHRSGPTLQSEFDQQLGLVRMLNDVAADVAKEPEPDAATARLRRILVDRERDLPRSFSLPVLPTFEATGVDPPNCRVMRSNARPLWLEVKSEQDLRARVLFKRGDDLRSDMLVLQTLRVMDSLWRRANLNMGMELYRAIVLEHETGMVEMVEGTKTLRSIQEEIHGGIRSAVSEDVITAYLERENRSDRQLSQARENFVRSCAAYAVATYVLGIGDRHNDNIMMRPTGNLFHIDFGYFYGMKMHVGGVYERENAPFVLTSQFIHAMGGLDSPGYANFVNYCVRLYEVLRQNSDILLQLFRMMVSLGIDQLHSYRDLDFLRDRLQLGKTSSEARLHFRTLIDEARRNIRVLLNHVAHSLNT